MTPDLRMIARAIAAELEWDERAIMEPASFFHCPRCGRLNVRDSLNHRGLCTRECEAGQ